MISPGSKPASLRVVQALSTRRRATARNGFQDWVNLSYGFAASVTASNKLLEKRRPVKLSRTFL